MYSHSVTSYYILLFSYHKILVFSHGGSIHLRSLIVVKQFYLIIEFNLSFCNLIQNIGLVKNKNL